MPKQKTKFNKRQWLTSTQFDRTDTYLMSALLEDNQSYSIDDVKKLIEKERKRGVN